MSQPVLPNISRSMARGQPTINDVAAMAGVSKKTVSRVINNSELLSPATRQRVEEAIKTLGFVPNPQARALALRRNHLIVLFHDNPNAQTVLNFQQGVLDAIKDSHLALVVRPVSRQSSSMIDDMRSFLERQRPMGALLLPPISENDAVAQCCNDLGVRYVRVGSAMLDDDDHSVASNDRDVVGQACRRLIALGHRRIGFIRGPRGFRSAEEREKGFNEAMIEAGIAVDTEMVFVGNYRFESGREAGRAMLRAPEPPTAIFASNDEMAAGVVHVAQQLGVSIPAQLSVIGFDDSPTASHIWPSLSTVRWPITEMGALAARKLVSDQLDGDQPPALDGVSVLDSAYIERNSVAPPPRPA